MEFLTFIRSARVVIGVCLLPVHISLSQLKGQSDDSTLDSLANQPHLLPSQHPWIGIGEHHTVLMKQGHVYYAGKLDYSIATASSLSNSRKASGFCRAEIEYSPKGVLASGDLSYLLDDEGVLRCFQGLDLNYLLYQEKPILNVESLRIPLWASSSDGFLLAGKEEVDWYLNGTLDTSITHKEKIILPASPLDVTMQGELPVFLLEGGLVASYEPSGVFSYQGMFKNPLSIKTTEDAIWVLDESGSVYRIQEGDRSLVLSSVPFTKIAAGMRHVLALDENGFVWAWGDNELGQLGLEDASMVRVPRRIDKLSGIVDIAAGYDQSFALGLDGELWAWGNNASGQLGLANASNVQRVPEVVSTLNDVSSRSVDLGDKQALKKRFSLRILYPETGTIVRGDAPF